MTMHDKIEKNPYGLLYRKPDAKVYTIPDKAEKWQPIQTAPKDREILIASYDAGIKVAEWDEDREVWTYGCVATDWNYYLDVYRPTHWMELPDKPKDGE